VHHQVAVGEGDGAGDRHEQAQPRGEVAALGPAVLGDRPAGDVFQDEVGAAVNGRAAVQQPGDVGVGEGCEDLPLDQEAAQDLFGVHAPLDQLDRHLLVVGGVVAHRQVDRAHAAPAELGGDAVGADPGAGGGGLPERGDLGCGAGEAALQEIAGLLGGGEQGEDLLAERAVAATGALDEGPPFGSRQVEGSVEQLSDPQPRVGRRVVGRGLRRHGRGACPAAAGRSRPWRGPSRA
jgi:hypothetical protein